MSRHFHSNCVAITEIIGKVMYSLKILFISHLSFIE